MLEALVIQESARRGNGDPERALFIFDMVFVELFGILFKK